MVGPIIFGTTFLFLIYFFTAEKHFFFIAVALLFVLLSVQYKSTKLTNFDKSKLTEMEKIEQLRHMNEYPPFAYRLANILEARQEAILYFKLEKNFVDIFNLELLFGDFRMFVLLPFFVIGLTQLTKKFPKETMILSLPPIILMTIIGHTNLYGPISLYPLLYCGIVFGLFLSFRKFVLKNEK